MSQNIGFNLMKGAFGPSSHDVYVTYDELTDELIVRVIDPTRPTYIEETDEINKYGFIVEDDSDEVVGFHLYNFERDHLPDPSWSNLRKVWDKVKESYGKGGYIKFHYDAPKTKRDETAPLMTTPRFLIQSAKVLQKELVKSPA